MDNEKEQIMIPYFCHEGDMARAERTIKRLWSPGFKLFAIAFVIVLFSLLFILRPWLVLAVLSDAVKPAICGAVRCLFMLILYTRVFV